MRQIPILGKERVHAVFTSSMIPIYQFYFFPLTYESRSPLYGATKKKKALMAATWNFQWHSKVALPTQTRLGGRGIYLHAPPPPAAVDGPPIGSFGAEKMEGKGPRALPKEMSRSACGGPALSTPFMLDASFLRRRPSLGS